MDRKAFEARLNDSVSSLHRIFSHSNGTGSVEHFGQLHQQYEVTFSLASCLCQCFLDCAKQCLDQLGLLSHLDGRQIRSLNLRLRSEQFCRFLRQETRTEQLRSETTETKFLEFFRPLISIFETKHTSAEAVWELRNTFEFSIAAKFADSRDENATVVSSSDVASEVRTPFQQNSSPPVPNHSIRPQFEVDLHWLAPLLSSNATNHVFQIDRAASDCRTARRNAQVQCLVDASIRFVEEAQAVINTLSQESNTTIASLVEMLSLDIFNPLLPLVWSNPDSSPASSSSSSSSSSTKALNEETASGRLSDLYQTLVMHHREALEAGLKVVSTQDMGRAGISMNDARFLVVLSHVSLLCQQLVHALDHLERVLAKQICSALGRELDSNDFTKYMEWRNARVFAGWCKPRRFSYKIRADNESAAEGSITLLHRDSVIATQVRCIPAHQAPEMCIRLGAGITARFRGDHFIHSWIRTDFNDCEANSEDEKARIVARTAPFAGCLVLVGTILTATEFQPQYAFLLKNECELDIPLQVVRLPSAQQFRDAIVSLSPVQQSFARLFRDMQLSSTLFALCIVQVKPQLESLLGLPRHSLNKEVELTQDLVGLFSEFQIPSDLLVADTGCFNTAFALRAVKNNAARVQGMIHKERARIAREAWAFHEAERQKKAAAAAAAAESKQDEEKRLRSADRERFKLSPNEPYDHLYKGTLTQCERIFLG